MIAASGTAAMFAFSVLPTMPHGCDIDNPLAARPVDLPVREAYGS